MEYLNYFIGFFLIIRSQDLGVPREHRPKLLSVYGILKMALVIAGVFLVVTSKVL